MHSVFGLSHQIPIKYIDISKCNEIFFYGTVLQWHQQLNKAVENVCIILITIFLVPYEWRLWSPAKLAKHDGHLSSFKTFGWNCTMAEKQWSQAQKTKYKKLWNSQATAMTTVQEHLHFLLTSIVLDNDLFVVFNWRPSEIAFVAFHVYLFTWFKVRFR